MEQPAESDHPGEAAEARPRPLLEEELRNSVAAVRMASGDAYMAAWVTQRVLEKLRKVAPDLVAAAEDEVNRGV